MTHLLIFDNGYHDLTLTRTVTCDVPWKLLNVGHKLRLLSLRCSTAYTASKRDGLACYLAVERAEKKLLRVGRAEEVEPAPIDAGGGGWQGVVRVPEEGGCVCEVARGS